MSNIDKQAVTAKTKELASLMVERFSMNPVSCKLLNEAWKKEFPDEVAIAERMLVLLDELEAKDVQIAELDERLLRYAGIATRRAEHVAELEKRIAELERERAALRPVGVMSEAAFHRLENSKCRFIALFPRPGIYLPRKRPADGVIVYARTATSINLETGGE